MARITASNWRQFVGTTWRGDMGEIHIWAIDWPKRHVDYDIYRHRTRGGSVGSLKRFLAAATQTGGEPVKEDGR